jgi:hypothetical protein
VKGFEVQANLCLLSIRSQAAQLAAETFRIERVRPAQRRRKERKPVKA